MKPEKRQKIMKAAEDLFSRGRFHEITMDDVARKAGVGKGTIYRYFKDKDELFFEVALSGSEELCRVIQAESGDTRDFRTSLVNACRKISEFHRSRRRLVPVMQAEERRALWMRGRGREVWLKKREQLVKAVTTILEKGRKEQCIRDDVSLEMAALFLLSMLRTRGRESRIDAGPGISYEQIVDFFLHGAAGIPAKTNKAEE